MKKLDRALAQIPSSLANYNHSNHMWDNVTSAHKSNIWLELYKIQGRFCAYCESPTQQGRHTGHIEHFFHKGCQTYVNLTFEWTNLFGCCAANLHCGHFKDKTLPGGNSRVYNPNLLLKPDIDDPECYLQFSPSGHIRKRDDLNQHQEERADETIRVLNLIASSLISSRESQIDLYKKRLLELSKLAQELSLSDDDFNILYSDIETEAQSVAHSTAIKHAIF